MTSRSGFTLLEVLVTLVVIGVATSVAALGFSGYLSEDAGGTTLEQQIRSARRSAVLEGHPVRLLIDSVGGEPLLFLPDGRLLGSAPLVEEGSRP